MQNIVQTDNQRESYRCAVDESKQAAAVRAGGDWVSVELLDESAGGFGVRIGRPLDAAVGDLVQLRLGDECFEARVMNVVEQAPSGDGSEPAFRLGLKRVGEIFLAASEEKRPWFERFKRPRRHKPFGSAKSLFYAALIFVAMAGAMPAIIFYLFDSSDSLFVSHTDGGPNEVGQPWNSNSEPSGIRPAGTPVDSVVDFSNNKTIKHFLFGTKPSPAEPRLNERRDTSLSLLLDHANFQSDIGKWSDAVLAVAANLVEKLGLTNPQKKEVSGILKDADEEITRLNVPDPDNTPQKVARQRVSILETAYGKLVQVFTDTQRIQWNELVKKWSETLQSQAGTSEFQRGDTEARRRK